MSLESSASVSPAANLSEPRAVGQQRKSAFAPQVGDLRKIQALQTNFEHYLLGETQGEVQVQTREENRLAAVAIARKARCTLDIVSRSLDRMVYDNSEFVNSVKMLITGNRRACIRVLVHDVQPLISRGHGLVRLARRLSTFVSFRIPAKEHSHYNSAFLVADHTGVIYNPLADRYEGTVNFDHPSWSRDLTELFDEMWDTGAPDPNLRRLHL